MRSLLVILFAASNASAGGLRSFKGEWLTPTEQYAQEYVQNRGHENLQGTLDELIANDKALVSIWQKRSAKKMKNCSFDVKQNGEEVELTLTVKEAGVDGVSSNTVVLPKKVFDLAVEYKENRHAKLSAGDLKVEAMVTPYRQSVDGVIGLKEIFIATQFKGVKNNLGEEQILISMLLASDGSAINQSVSFGPSMSCVEKIK